MEAEYGKFELDESYFGARRVRGKRGRGAAEKTPVFGVLKRDGDVFVYHHYRVYHSHNEFVRGKPHINGIESFWSYAKRECLNLIFIGKNVNSAGMFVIR